MLWVAPASRRLYCSAAESNMVLAVRLRRRRDCRSGKKITARLVIELHSKGAFRREIVRIQRMLTVCFSRGGGFPFRSDVASPIGRLNEANRIKRCFQNPANQAQGGTVELVQLATLGNDAKASARALQLARS